MNLFEKMFWAPIMVIGCATVISFWIVCVGAICDGIMFSYKVLVK